MTARPKKFDKDTIKEVALKLTERLNKGLGLNPDEEFEEEDLYEVLSRCSQWDGYELTKELESLTFCIGDTQIVELLDSADYIAESNCR